MAGWLVNWLAGWLTGWMARWLAGRLAGWLAGWLDKIMILTAESSWKLVSGGQYSGTFGRENENLMELSFSRPKVPGSWRLEANIQELSAVRMKILAEISPHRIVANCVRGGSAQVAR